MKMKISEVSYYIVAIERDEDDDEGRANMQEKPSKHKLNDKFLKDENNGNKQQRIKEPKKVEKEVNKFKYLATMILQDERLDEELK